MALKTLQDALEEELQDVLSAEKQLVRALPKMAKAASNPALKAAIEEHLAQTKEHVTRVEQAFGLLGKKPKSKTCEAMKGLLEEGQSVLEEEAEPEVLDAMIIAAAQKVEHYEIATYGTLCTWAKTAGHANVKQLLGQTLNEEEKTDKNLSKLAISINAASARPAPPARKSAAKRTTRK